MRTLVIGDLHLGAHRGLDVLRRPGPLAALTERLRDVDRLVLLGDAVEGRHTPWRRAVELAAPVFAAFGEALGPDAEVVLVPGNHDHGLFVAPALELREGPLALDGALDLSPAARHLADALGGPRLEVRYPGARLREDVFATHGHYLDRLITVPTFERLAAGAMVRVVGDVPGRGAVPEDFEAALAPMYAWLHAVAQSKGSWSAKRQSASAQTWQTLTGSGERSLRGRLLAAGFPVLVKALNRAGVGPVRPNLSGEELRRATLRAFGDVVGRLGLAGTPHVLFGHTHRAGPLPGDDLGEWRVGATQLHNAGCWVSEPVFAKGGPSSPYWAGRALELDDEPGTAPRLVRLVEDLGLGPVPVG